MKAVPIEVPQEGTSVQLVSHGGVSPAQAVIVMSDEVELRYKNPGLESAAPPARTDDNPTEKHSLDLDAISAAVLKLRPKSRTAAVDVIKTFFQFSNPISADTANKLFEELRRRGDLSLTPDGEIQFAEQKESAAR